MEQFENEPEDLHHHLTVEEEKNRDRDCNNIFKKLLESMIVEDHHGIINKNSEFYTELFKTIKKPAEALDDK